MSSVTVEIQGLNPPGQGDEEDAGGFAKRFPMYHANSKYLEADCCGSAIPLDHDKVEVTSVDWERGIVHCVLIPHLLKISRVTHTSNFIL